jgi:hypothetical protein
MNFRERLKRPDVMIRIGLASLAMSGLMRLFLHPPDVFWRDVFDGMSGFLTGITIAAILLGLWKQRRQSA